MKKHDSRCGILLAQHISAKCVPLQRMESYTSSHLSSWTVMNVYNLKGFFTQTKEVSCQELVASLGL